MIEKPKPLLFLGETPSLTPKTTLKHMLEASNRQDKGQEPHPSPLATVDPMSLDILMNRIDSGALALNQVPDLADREQLVAYYWSERAKFALDQQMGIVTRGKRKAVAPAITVSKDTILGLLKQDKRAEEKEFDENDLNERDGPQ